MTATAIASSRDGRGVFLLGAAASASAAGGHAVAGPGVPEVVLAAAALAADGVSFLLVGSAALWLRSEPVTVADVDVVIKPGLANLRCLHAALVSLALRPRDVPAPRRPAGQVALAAERGELAPVPVGLINGTTYQWGTRPPFRPAAVLEAIRQVLARPKTTSEQITAIVGPPDFMTGCAVTGDLAGLADGLPVDLHLHARVTITDAAHLSSQLGRNVPDSWFTPGQLNPTVLVIDDFPPSTGPSEVARAIASRARQPRWAADYPDLHARTGLPVKDVADLSSHRGGYLLVCVPEPDADRDELRRQLTEIDGVTVRIPAALPRPLAKMIRDWTRAWPGEDLPASLIAFEVAIACGWPYDAR